MNIKLQAAARLLAAKEPMRLYEFKVRINEDGRYGVFTSAINANNMVKAWDALVKDLKANKLLDHVVQLEYVGE